MIPRDVFLVFEGWQKAYSPSKAGAKAPTLDEARELAERYA